MADRPPFQPAALGEIALRCRDFPAMVSFYETVIGLHRLAGQRNPGIVFFGFGESAAGHTAVLALFDDVPTGDGGSPRPVAGPGSSLHHFALALPRAAQDTAIAWFRQTGQPFRIEVFGWVGWRGVFLTDPDGNTVELVAYDASFSDPADT